MILGNKYRLVKQIKSKKELLKDHSKKEIDFILDAYNQLKERKLLNLIGFDTTVTSIYKEVKKPNEEIVIGTKLCLGRINSSCDKVEYVTKIELLENYYCKIITNNGYIMFHDDYFIWTNEKIDEWIRTHIGYVDLQSYFIDTKKLKNYNE